MDYVVGSIAALISGNVTPNRPKQLRKAQTPIKHQPSPNVTPKCEFVEDRSIFLSPTMQKKKAIAKKSPKRIFQNPDLDGTNEEDGDSSISSPKVNKVKKHLKEDLEDNSLTTQVMLSPKSPKNERMLANNSPKKKSKKKLSGIVENVVTNEKSPQKNKRKSTTDTEELISEHNGKEENDKENKLNSESTEKSPKNKRKRSKSHAEPMDIGENISEVTENVGKFSMKLNEQLQNEENDMNSLETKNKSQKKNKKNRSKQNIDHSKLSINNSVNLTAEHDVQQNGRNDSNIEENNIGIENKNQKKKNIQKKSKQNQNINQNKSSNDSANLTAEHNSINKIEPNIKAGNLSPKKKNKKKNKAKNQNTLTIKESTAVTNKSIEAKLDSGETNSDSPVIAEDINTDAAISESSSSKKKKKEKKKLKQKKRNNLLSENEVMDINPNAVTNKDTDSEHDSDNEIESENEEINKGALDTGPVEDSSDEEPEGKVKKSDTKKPSPRNSEDEAKTTLFVGNVPFSLKCKKEIKRIFGKYGKILSIRIRDVPVKDARFTPRLAAIKNQLHPDRTSVHVYVHFQNASSVDEALKENNTILNGHHLHVDRSSTTGAVHDPKCSVFVGNIPFMMEDEALRQKFEKCGEIESVRIVRDKKTKIGKGFGYVNFASKDGVELSLALSEEDLTIKNRIMRVKRCTQITHNKSGKDTNRGNQQMGNFGKGKESGIKEGALRRIAKKRKIQENGEGPPNKRQNVNQPHKEKKERKEFVGMTAEKKKKKKFDKGLKKKKALSQILTKS